MALAAWFLRERWPGAWFPAGSFRGRPFAGRLFLLGDDVLDVGRLDGDGPFRPLHGEHHLVAPTADLRNLAGHAAVGFDLLAFLKDPEFLPVLVGELHFLAGLVNDALDLGNGDSLHVAIGVNDLDGSARRRVQLLPEIKGEVAGFVMVRLLP